MINDNFIPWLYLSTKTNISKKKLYALYKHYKSGRAIVAANHIELSSLGLLSESQIQSILSYDPSAVAPLIEAVEKNEMSLITPECESYPDSFRYLDNPPSVMYVKGRLLNLNEYLCIASIGTREPTPYGRGQTYRIVQGLAKAGVLIVSGMAQGVDAISHKAAIDAHAPTVAFLGNGADVIYPAMNADIYREIVKNGMVISEYIPGTKARAYQFPERNRLVAAAGEGLFLSEAAIKSGSSITCNLSLNLGKDVFALPGNVDSPMSKLPISLLKDGAIPVDSSDDIISYYKENCEEKLINGKKLSILQENVNSIDKRVHDTAKDVKPSLELSDKEKISLALKAKPMVIDELSDVIGLGLSELSVLLLMMEMENKIKEDNGKFYLID